MTAILTLWRRGHTALEIAHALRIDEADVFAALKRKD